MQLAFADARGNGVNFFGPFFLENCTPTIEGGIYAILVNDPTTHSEYSPLYFGEAESLIEVDFESHPELQCWGAHCGPKQALWVAFTYVVEEEGRRILLAELIEAHNPVCNEETIAPPGIYAFPPQIQ